MELMELRRCCGVKAIKRCGDVFITESIRKRCLIIKVWRGVWWEALHITKYLIITVIRVAADLENVVGNVILYYVCCAIAPSQAF